jgi:hypothetical protein
MNAITLCMSNPISDFRADEMNNWYTAEHVLTCMLMDGSIAVQRFKQSKFQPKDAYLDFSVIALYEIFDLDAWTSMCYNWGRDPHKMPVSSAFGNFCENFWKPGVMVDDFADFADYEGDKSVLLVKFEQIGDLKPDAFFSKEVLKRFRTFEGFKTAHLLETAGTNPSTSNIIDSSTHMLVGQLSNSYFAKVSWDTFVHDNPKLNKLFNIRAVIYDPVMPRTKACDVLKDPVSQSLFTITRQLMRLQLPWGDHG